METIDYSDNKLRNKSVLVTGGAGFIGSSLVEYLIKVGTKKIRILDNLSTGHISNIGNFLNTGTVEFIEGDIRDLKLCQESCKGIDFVLHQAALGSVPRSILDPITTNEVNITGFLNILLACRDNQIKRLIYAASSSTYGDSSSLPKVEEVIGMPLSPYAVTKYVNELYAGVFSKIYGIETIGLRYFNVFGSRQSPNGPYAAVIPLFLEAIRMQESPNSNGDGNQSRDFTYIDNVIQANIKSLFVENPLAVNQIYNIAYGEKISLNDLWSYLNELFGTEIVPNYREARIGDVRHSLADISKAKALLDYSPKIGVLEGLKRIAFK